MTTLFRKHPSLFWIATVLFIIYICTGIVLTVYLLDIWGMDIDVGISPISLILGMWGLAVFFGALLLEAYPSRSRRL